MKKLIISTIEASTNNVLFSIKTQKFSAKYIVTVGVLMWNNVVCYSKMGENPYELHEEAKQYILQHKFDFLSPVELYDRFIKITDKKKKVE